MAASLFSNGAFANTLVSVLKRLKMALWGSSNSFVRQQMLVYSGPSATRL